MKKVRGKEGILFRLADAAIGQPDKTVRTALYPVVGEKTLRDLGPVWRCDQPVAFRRSLIQIIEARRWRPAR